MLGFIDILSFFSHSCNLLKHAFYEILFAWRVFFFLCFSPEHLQCTQLQNEIVEDDKNARRNKACLAT